MAKLTTVRFHHKNETGEILDFDASVTLDQDGTFNVPIPDDLAETARAIDPRKHQVYLTRPSNAKQTRVSGKRLDDCKAFIELLMREHMKCEVTRELVICYNHSLKVCYSVDENGGVHPNGYIAEQANGKGKYGRHGGELDATHHAPLFSVGLCAEVRDKVTYRRNSGNKVVYEQPKFPGSHFVFDTPAKRLNSFAGLALDPRFCEEMPYTDQAADFFYDAMLAMCKLAEQVKNFFGDKDALMLAIDKRANLLPGPSTALQET